MTDAPIKIKICPGCGAENGAGELECGCGYDLLNVRPVFKAAQFESAEPKKEARVRICTECGHLNPISRRQCEACGEDVSDVTPIVQSSCAKKAALRSLDGAFTHELPEAGTVLLGREGDLAEHLAGKPYVSRNQAKVHVTPGGLVLEALPSTNPTFINQQILAPLSRITLENGDEIGLGGTVIGGARQERAAYLTVVLP